MFYIEGIEAAAHQAHARVREHVTHGQLTELLQMLEAIGIVKVGAPPAPIPVPLPIVSQAAAPLPPGATIVDVQTVAIQTGAGQTAAAAPEAPAAEAAAAAT